MEKRPAPAPVDIPAFAAAQLDLLAAELQSEMAENSAAVGSHTPAALQRAGLALTNLVVEGRRTGMGGRTVLTLALDGALSVASGPSESGRGGGGSNSGSNGSSSKGRDSDGPELPEHGLRTGDIVLVAEQPGGSAKKREMRELEKRGSRGVITRTRRSVLEVGLDYGGGGEEEENVDALLSGRVWLVKLADDVTFRRMSAAMQTLQTMPASSYSSLIQVLFGLSSPSPVEEKEEKEDGAVEWIDPTLNDSQKRAVRFALASKEVALIHGPPGTGKTHTLIELILQMVGRGQRVLVCGPSNISVDNLVERLAPHGVPMVRLGHPARLLPSVLGHALDVLTQTSEAGAIVRDVRADMDARQGQLRRIGAGGGGSSSSNGGAKGGKMSAAERRTARRAIYSELRDLRREYRERERRCVRDIVADSRVVLATLHGAGGSQLQGLASGDRAAGSFDVVIIDEVSQALEAQCWVPLLGAQKVVCAGDHLQLPPTVKTKKAGGTTTEKAGEKKQKRKKEEDFAAPSPPAISLEHTLFDRLLALHGDSIKRMLTTQYRMHERIMRFPSDTLYGGHLVAAEAVRGRLLRDIRYGAGVGEGETEKNGPPAAVTDTDDTREPLVFIDTQGGDFFESTEAADVEDAGARDKAKAKVKAKAGSKLLLGDSKCNAMEAALVRQHVRALVDAGVRPADIAVITPYNAQVALLAPLKTAYPGLEVGSVDGFQGREKEAVVVSLVRSNPAGDVGFLADKRRLNVAMTRPKRSLTVIGDSDTVGRGSSFLKHWMAFLEENADLRYPDSSAVAAEA